eukprot:scaffold3734_cov817-Pavlova_lutheri.AAC.1
MDHQDAELGCCFAGFHSQKICTSNFLAKMLSVFQGEKVRSAHTRSTSSTTQHTPSTPYLGCGKSLNSSIMWAFLRSMAEENARLQIAGTTQADMQSQ